MKILIDTDLAKVPGATTVDNVTSITASSADAAFPVGNLRDDFRTNLWKAAAGVYTATLTLQVSKGSCVALLNTNATAITITAGSGDSYALESGYAMETGYALADDEVATIPAYFLPGDGGRIWGEHTPFVNPYVVKIEITAATPPSAGIVRAGVVEEFKDPQRGLGEGSTDFSIEKTMNNGADYYRLRNIVRNYDNLSILESRANAYRFKHLIFDTVGPRPLAMRLIQNVNVIDEEFVIFAKRLAPPHIQHQTIDWTSITFGLREVI